MRFVAEKMLERRSKTTYPLNRQFGGFSTYKEFILAHDGVEVVVNTDEWEEEHRLGFGFYYGDGEFEYVELTDCDLAAEVNLKKTSYPEFSEIKKWKNREGGWYGHRVIVKSYLAIMACSPDDEQLWVATPDLTGKSLWTGSEEFPFTEEGYEKAKKAYEERILMSIIESRYIANMYLEE